ncbi:MAG: mechanosensitive ion channel family protein, partial [Candidatus Binatia bacterium]
VLDTEVFPRLRMPPGVPFALTTFTRYAVIFAGFVIALGLIGFSIDRVTILLGALGVGLGFGLQNVVNNFVSGLILLLERPIRLGDVIEFGGVAGWVSRIGIRSSTIETFEGAEVIVPNAMLIAERVTNWTYSASRRRIEVLVGVAYGADPNVVLALLERIAAAQEDLLRQPAPQALFLGFGQSSLDFALRAWTSSYDQAAVTRSRLAVAVHAALRDAEIEIPFPQRELRVRETAPAVEPKLPAPVSQRS